MKSPKPALKFKAGFFMDIYDLKTRKKIIYRGKYFFGIIRFWIS